MDIKRVKKNQAVWRDVKPIKPAEAVKTSPKTTISNLTYWQKIRIAYKLLIKLPAYNQIKLRLKKTPRKKLVAYFTIVAILFLFGAYQIGTTIYKQLANNSKNTSYTNDKPVLKKGTPSYSTVTPADKDIKDYGGWTRVSPPNSDPVYAYADKIDNIPITISEQQLPDDLKTNTEQQIRDLALKFNAKNKIVVGSTTVYIGTSANGPQSVIFTKNNLLILIKSDDHISDNQWSNYINSLQ